MTGTLIARLSNEPTSYNKLGHMYKVLRNKVQAIQNYEEAVKLAKKRNYPRLTQFKKDLVNIRKK